MTQKARTLITREQAEALQKRFETQDTGAALGKLLMAAAGVWILGEILGASDKPKPRAKRQKAR